MLVVISQERAEQILSSHREPIGACLWNAWEQWRATSLPIGVTARARANLVYDYAVEEARRTLDGRTGLVLTEERGFLAVNVEEKLLLRFKKFRKGLNTSGIPTRQRQLFDLQQLTFDGIESVTGIVAGYELDEFQHGIRRVAITCRVGSSLRWMIPLEKPATPGVIPITAPTEMSPSSTEVRSTIRKEEESSQQES